MSFRSSSRRLLSFAVAVIWTAMAVDVAAQKVSLPEAVEWAWEVRPVSPSSGLPNVLLLGDSITRAYFPQVTKELQGVANVYLMATSASVGDPRLPPQIAEFSSLEHVRFRVVHFNNGMHGWDYTETQYRAGFPSFLHAVQTIPGHAALMWATTTPVQADQSAGPSNSRIDERNRIAKSFIRAAGIAIDDQHTLMATHQDLQEDNVHYKERRVELMSEQAAYMIKQALTHPSEMDRPKGS